ncbi:MAG: zinc metallopeptidase [Rhizobiales bacterium]|nr:zinc metallopeptidase [Hyphomicrobiales bacterium]
MRLDDERASDNVEDRRGRGGGGFRFPGGGGRRVRLPSGRRGGGIGIGGIIILLILSFVFGINPLDLLSGGGGSLPQQSQYQAPQPSSGSAASNDEMKVFVSKVLGTTERTWQEIFSAQGKRYRAPKMVLFSGYVQSACGAAQSAMGPFYCPLDSKVYIDLSFYRDMRAKLGAPGDFAQAYVIAHEVGHHVQNLLGIAKKVTQARMRSSKAEGNALSVRMELQADCFSGVWAHDNKRLLERGDIEEGLNAASAIGDDRLQKRQQGYVVPESFTHGSSAQRVRWFKRGLETGNIRSCDTFGASQL